MGGENCGVDDDNDNDDDDDDDDALQLVPVVALTLGLQGGVGGGF